ncbi:MAG: phosphoglycerate kinase [Patescibacteria group bacterium]
MKIQSIKKIKNLKNKIVFLRVDFNVPLSKGKIKDDYKIKAGLETIKYLVERGARIIVATHLGEPVKKFEVAYSVRPVAARLRTLLKRSVKFLPEAVGLKTRTAVKNMKPGEIIMFENLRFYPGEYNNDPSFAAELAAPADIYINDALAVSHRAQASVDAIKNYLPSYAGLLLEQELYALNKILQPQKPLVVIIGGAKIKTKAPLILKLQKVADKILVGGGLANNFFKFQGLEIGRSLVDDNSAAVIKKFFNRKKLNSKIILPSDVVVKTKNGQIKVVKPGAVQATDRILDIGPSTIADFAVYIKTAQTLVWNGPLGLFEEASFKHGTLAIATLMAARSSGRAYGLVGGGETVEALKLTKMTKYIDWISTAGGAMLTFLGGGKMPGLNKIISNY